MISTLKNLVMGTSQSLPTSSPASQHVNQVHKSKKRKREERRSSLGKDMKVHNDEAFAQNQHHSSHVDDGDTNDATPAHPKKKKKRKSTLEGETGYQRSVAGRLDWGADLEDDVRHEGGVRSRQKKKRKSRGHPQEDQQNPTLPMITQVLNAGEAGGEGAVKDSQIEIGDQAITKSKKRKKSGKPLVVGDISIQDVFTGNDFNRETSHLDSRAERALVTSKKKRTRKNKSTDEDVRAETEDLEVNSNHRKGDGEVDNEEAPVKSKKFRKSGNSIAREGSAIRHLQHLDSTHDDVQVAATPLSLDKAEGVRREEEDLAAPVTEPDSEAIFTSTLNDALGQRQPAPVKAPALTKKQKKRARKDRELSRNKNLLSVGETQASHADDINDHEVQHGSELGILPSDTPLNTTPAESSMISPFFASSALPLTNNREVVSRALSTPTKKSKAKTPTMMPKISSSQSSNAPDHSQTRLKEQSRNSFSPPNISQRKFPVKQSSHATPSSVRNSKIPATEPSFSVVYPSETPQDSARPASTPGNASKTPVADLEAIDRAIEIFREAHGMSQFDINGLIWEPQKDMSDVQKEFWNIFPEAVPHLTNTTKLRRIVRGRHHNFNRGPWSVEEDEELRDLYESFPNQWAKLSGLINRPPDSIKTRWKQVLVNGNKLVGLRGMVRWTLAEELKLRDAVADCIKHIQDLRHSNKEFAKKAQGQTDEELIHWQTVSDKMGRTRSFPKCLAKWKQLQARAAEDGETLHENTPSSRQGRGHVENAKRIAQDLQAPEILQMLYAIRVTEAGTESKIPWDRVIGAIETSTERNVRSLAHSTCFRKLREKVPGSEHMPLREVLDVLIDAFEASEPEIPDQFKDHEYIRPIRRKVKRNSLSKNPHPTSSKYVQDDSDDNGSDHSPNSNGDVSLQAGDDTEINNPVDAQEVPDEGAPSEQRRKKKKRSEVPPESNQETPQLSQKKKKKNKSEINLEGNEEMPQLSQRKKKRKSKAVGDEDLKGDLADGVDHQGPADTMQTNLPTRQANSIPNQTLTPENNRDKLAIYLDASVTKALQTIMESPRINPRQKRRLRNDLIAAMHDSGFEPLTSQDEASNEAGELADPQVEDSDDQHWLRGLRSKSKGREGTIKVYNDEWNGFEDGQDSVADKAYIELAEESSSKFKHINQEEGRNEAVARKLTLAIDSLLPDATSLTSKDPKQILRSTPAVSLSSQGRYRDTFSPVFSDTQSCIDVGEVEVIDQDANNDLLLPSGSNEVTNSRINGHETLAGHVLDKVGGLDSSNGELHLGSDALGETVDLDLSQEDLFDLEIPKSHILQVVIPVRNERAINASSSCGEEGEMPRSDDSEEEMLLDSTASNADPMATEAYHEQHEGIMQVNNNSLSKQQHILESGLALSSCLDASNHFSLPASERALRANPSTDNDNDPHPASPSSVIERDYKQDSSLDDVDVGPAVLIREKHRDTQAPPTHPQLRGRAKGLSVTGMIFPSLLEQKSKQESEHESKLESTESVKNVKLEEVNTSLFGDEHNQDLEMAITHEQGHLQQRSHTEEFETDNEQHLHIDLMVSQRHIHNLNIEHANLVVGESHAFAYEKEKGRCSHHVESPVITRTESEDSTMVKMVKASLPFGRRTVDSHYRASTESSVSEQFVDALEMQEVEEPNVGLHSVTLLGERLDSNQEANILEDAPQHRGQEPDAQTDVEMGYDAEDEEAEWDDHEVEQATSIPRVPFRPSLCRLVPDDSDQSTSGGSAVPRGSNSRKQLLVDDSQEGNSSSRSSIEVSSPKFATSPRNNPRPEVAPPVSEPRRRNLRNRNKVVNYDVAHYFNTHKEREHTLQLIQAVQPTPKPKPRRRAQGAAKPQTKKKGKRAVYVDSSDDDIPAEVLRSPRPVDDESSSEVGWGPSFTLPTKYSKSAMRKELAAGIQSRAS